VTEAVHEHAAAGRAAAMNLALRFLLELAALAALAFWGVDTGHSVLGRVALGVGAPLVAAVVWGLFAAPKSARRLRGPALVAVQLGVLGTGVVALAAAAHRLPAALLAVAVAVNTVLLQVREGEPTP
jgi:Protein of unknown function (DUF2568)